MHIEQKLQQLIDELKVERDKAIKKVKECYKAKKISFAVQASGEEWALSLCIQKLTEILNEVSVAASSNIENDNESKSANWRHNLRG